MIELGYELLGDFDRPSHLKWCSDDCIRQSYGDTSHKIAGQLGLDARLQLPRYSLTLYKR